MELLEKIAVLIDADNTEYGKLEPLLQRIMTHGRIVLKRAYGNWKKDALKHWADDVKRLAIKPEHQVDYVAKKNATDIALVIDAMELLHQKIYDGFVIVSSDSDYTPLAIKLKESGIYVIGAGKRNAAESFIQACDDFIKLEDLPDPKAASNAKKSSTEKQKKVDGTTKSTAAPKRDELYELLKTAWETWQEEDGYANVSSAGSYIKRVKPDFDIKEYGFSKIPQYLENHEDLYEVKRYKEKRTVIVAYKIK